MLLNKTYSLGTGSTLLTSALLKFYINLFFNEVIITNNKHLLLMIKVEFCDNSLGYKTLGDLRKVNFTDKDLFTAYLTDRLGILNESYHVNPIKNIVFSYILKDGLAEGNRMLLQKPEYNVKIHKFNSMVLPLSMNPSDYGDVFISVPGKSVVKNGSNTFLFDTSHDGLINKVSISGPKDIKWIDTKLESTIQGNDDLFKREIGSSILYIRNGAIILSEKVLNAKAFKPLAKEKKNYRFK